MQDFYINLVEYLYENLEKALDKIFLEEKKEKQKINFLVKASDEPQFGDFATNISMICAKVFKINLFNIFCCYKQNFFKIEN